MMEKYSKYIQNLPIFNQSTATTLIFFMTVSIWFMADAPKYFLSFLAA